jgi:hypothetical protein
MSLLSVTVSGSPEEVRQGIATLYRDFFPGDGSSAPASTPPGTPPQAPPAHALPAEVQAVIARAPGGAPRDLLHRFITEVCSWPGVTAVAHTPHYLAVKKGDDEERIVTIRPRKPRLNLRLSTLPEGAEHARLRKLRKASPRMVTLVLWSEGTLEEALRLAKAAYDAAA